MPIGLLFWMLMILWLVFGIFNWWPVDEKNRWPFGGHILLFVLLFLVGWKLFGFMIQ